MRIYKATYFDASQSVILTETIEAKTRLDALEQAKTHLEELTGGTSYRIDPDGKSGAATRPMTKNGMRAGVRTQSTSFTFRVDDDISAAFRAVANKGRMINDLLRETLLCKTKDPNPLDERERTSLTDYFDQQP